MTHLKVCMDTCTVCAACNLQVIKTVDLVNLDH